MQSKWRTSVAVAGAWHRWLSDHGSLTRRLQARCATLRVQRLRQAHACAHEDERALLHLRAGRLALVREVLLSCDTTPLVFAHTVIPLAGLNGPWAGLVNLGNRPLGAALFADPRIQRHPLECRSLNPRHPLYRAAARHLAVPPKRLWARRSRFTLAGHSILVSEVFLPAVLDLPGILSRVPS